MGYFTTLSVSHFIESRMIGWLMNDELESILKDVSWPSWHIFLEFAWKDRENHKRPQSGSVRIASVSEIGTEHLRDTNLKRCCFPSLLGLWEGGGGNRGVGEGQGYACEIEWEKDREVEGKMQSRLMLGISQMSSLYSFRHVPHLML
jgi:hypothetical protein